MDVVFHTTGASPGRLSPLSPELEGGRETRRKSWIRHEQLVWSDLSLSIWQWQDIFIHCFRVLEILDFKMLSDFLMIHREK